MSGLLVVAGPSCAGKSPLIAALKRLYPGLTGGYEPLVLWNSREPRPGETDGIDYHFRPAREIESLRADPGFLVMEVRGDLQAVNLRELAEIDSDRYFEGNPFIGRRLMTAPVPAGVNRLGVFISPMSMAEIKWLAKRGADIPDILCRIMRERLLVRAANMGQEMNEARLADISRRAKSAWSELGMAHNFHYVIPNHDGEDSANWAFQRYPVGDALETVIAIAGLLAEEKAPGLEKWPVGFPCEEP